MTDASNQEWSENHHALLEVLQEWWNPPADLVATIPKGGVALQYVGHADVTRALIETDPCWSWEPMSYTEDGQPFLTLNEQGQPVGLWGWLTVCGVRRPGYGSCLPGKNEAVKELVGDFIRNAALRFGFCGGLWSKADRVEGAEKPSKAPRKKPEGNDTNEAGKANYDGLVKMYGETEVKGALAVLGISRWHELVGDVVDKVDDLLHAKKLLADEMGAKPE